MGVLIPLLCGQPGQDDFILPVDDAGSLILYPFTVLLAQHVGLFGHLVGKINIPSQQGIAL
jgi:hypothetical protein